MSITPTAPAGTAPTQEAAPPAPSAPSFIVDESFLANLGTPTGDTPLPEPSRTEPENGGSAPPPSPPEPTPLDEDDFSTGAAPAAPPPPPAPTISIEPPLGGSALKDTDPPWMHQALQELESDPDLDVNAKAVIKKIDPAAWRVVGDWKKTYDFRQTMQREDYDVPGHFDTHLAKLVRPEKVAAIKAHILLKTIDDPDALATFAKGNPQKYADLMTALVQVSPHVVEQVANRNGFTMAKLQELPAFDRAAALAEIQKDPNWNLIEANPDSAMFINGLLDNMEAAHKELSLARSQVQDLKGKIPTAPAEQEETPSVAPQILSDALTSQWVPNAQGALTQAGLAMPTEEEFKAYPFAANLMKTAITTAIHGMPGVMPGIFEELQSIDFDEDLNYGADSKSFTEALRAGDLAAGKRSALNLGRFFYEKAAVRAKTGFIQNMYNRGKREMALAKADLVKYKEFITLMRGVPETAPPPPTAPTNGATAEVLNTPPTTPENKAKGSGFLADQIFLDSLK